MSRTIQFFYEFSSPYSYIAAERIDALAARYGFALDWKPMLGVLFKTTGGAPLTMVHPWKVEYAMADFRRSAQAAGLPYAHPSKFPQSTQNAARAVLWLQATRPEAAVPFALEVFRTIFVRDGDATDPATLARIGATLDLDADAIGAAVQDPAIKQQLARNNDEAATLRIFGAPTVVVDGELFWGADRLGQLEQRLRQIAGGRTMHEMGLLGEIAHIDGGFEAWRAGGAPIVRAAPLPAVEKH